MRVMARQKARRPGNLGRKSVPAALALSLALVAFFAGSAWAVTIPVPEPDGLDEFIRDRNMAIVLGKALYWDMQVGSDGVTACASCHFHAGADARFRNQINPGQLGGDNTFNTAPPNAALKFDFFPLHKLTDPNDEHSQVISTSDDVISSQGVFLHDFAGVVPGSATDLGTERPDPVFNVNGINTRRVEPRNTPTVINAVFNLANFWDGRANTIFNGVNPFGPADLTSGVYVDRGTGLATELVRLNNSALASQAVGPPLSNFEMSFGGRTFPDIGKKMLSLQPLAKQLVHPQDGYLGPYSKATLDARGRARGTPGITKNYKGLIAAAFQPRYWANNTQIVRITDGIPEVVPKPDRALEANEFTQMEINFSLFFGLSIQLYEATLVSNDSPFDRFAAGDPSALTPQQQQGFEIFQGRGNCIVCHAGAEFTLATVNDLVGLTPEAVALTAKLDGGQVVPPVATAAKGLAVLTLDALRTKIVFDLRTENITDITSARIHSGVPGQNGPAMFTLSATGFVDRATGSLTEASFTPVPGIPTFADALQAMIKGETHLLVTTAASPSGEIRGQIEQAVFVMDARLSKYQVVPPTTSTAIASAEFISEPFTDRIDFEVSVTRINTAEVTAVDLRLGAVGQNGPVIFNLFVVPFNRNAIEGVLRPEHLIPAPGISTFAEAIDAMFAGETYVEIRTQAFPEGEIRGQVFAAPELLLNPIELMNMAVGRAFYDNGFYNTGIRLPEHDIGRGGNDPFGLPLSFSKLAVLKSEGLLPPEMEGFVPNLPSGVTDPPNRTAVNAAFKTPGLRNVELTTPYFHNGAFGTLRQVVDFYARGGNFSDENIENLAPLIAPIPGMDEAARSALVSFLLSLTDQRVKNESFPFDHPQLFVPNGQKGDENQILGDCSSFNPLGFKRCERIMAIPAVGAQGRSAAGFPPLRAPVDHFDPNYN